VPSTPLESPQPAKRSSGNASRRSPLAPTPLSTIPNVYFEENFQLENPRTFDIVSERSEIIRQPGANGAAVPPGPGGRKALATNAILQEKLSWYMDTVEVHLISSISTASTSFFAALGSLKELHTEASDSVAKIKNLREDLASLDNEMAIGGLKVVAMRRRRENVRKLGAAIQQLQDVVEAVDCCEKLVDKGEIESALECFGKVENLIAGERIDLESAEYPQNAYSDEALIDLRGIAALEGSANDLALLRRRIGKGFEARFFEALLGDLRQHVGNTPSSTTLQRWDKASQRARGAHARTPSVYPTYLQLDDLLRQTLRSNLEGLAKSDFLMPATTAYREGMLKETKNLIRRSLPSSNDDDAESTMSASTQGGRHLTQQERSSLLARNLRALDAENAETMLKTIYSNVGEALRRLGTQVKVLLDLTSGIKSPRASARVGSPLSPPMVNMDSYVNGSTGNLRFRAAVPSEDLQQALDMSSILGQAVDIAQTQITKVLKVRTEQSTHLPLPDFVRYFYLNKLFADECEAVSGRGGTSLKTVVNTHIKDFVSQFGNNERQILVQGMDADRWDAKDFTDSDNQALSRVLEASTRDVEAWAKASQLWPDAQNAVNGTKQPSVEGANGISASKDKVRSASIDEQDYLLPESAITVLRGIQSFEQLITGIPSMTSEVTSALLEYLKLFNSRSSQLILGAGATRSAGLKNITTKHLALASQALSFVAALIPHVREFIRRHSHSSGNLMMEFDKVKRLYQEHQAGINDKLVDIMSGRAGTHVNAMRNVDWDTTLNGQVASPYMETLVKETTTVHRVLSKHLPDMTVRMIMDVVFSSYREQWGKGFAEVEVKTAAGKQRMLRDVEFFRSRTSKLEGAGPLGDFLVQLVENKPVAEVPEKSYANASELSKQSPQDAGAENS
jgi:vacuolar protein sorting-associated protein 54